MAAVETAGVIEGAKPRSYQAGVANLQRGTLVIQGADDNHVVPAGANGVAFGAVNESVPNIGDVVSITRLGETVLIAGAAIQAGQRIISDANGHAIPTAAAADNLAGYAVTSAAVAGDYFLGFIVPSVR